jgi:Putative addiction module component
MTLSKRPGGFLQALCSDMVEAFARGRRGSFPPKTVEFQPGRMHFHGMPLTPDQIVEEVRHWPQQRLTELLDRLTSTLHTDDPGIEEAWKQETRRRIAEIENGAVQGVSGEEVSTRNRKLVGR